MSSISPLSYGKHNNIYFQIKIGSRKNPLIRIKLVGFFDSAKVYITETNITEYLYSVLDINKVVKIIEDLLESVDFDLHLFSHEDFLQNKDTKQILNLISNG